VAEIISGQNAHEPTDVRYGTRSLLVAMATFAVALTALSALLQSFPADMRPQLAVSWLVLFLILGACVAYNARRRYLAEKQAGVVRFRLVPHSYWFPRMPSLARALLGTLLLIYAPVIWLGMSLIAVAEDTPVWTQAFNWHTYFAIWASASGMNYLWWHRKVRVCEHGLVVRHKFIPWGDCRRWYWDAVYRDVIVVGYNQNEKVALKTPTEERAAVEGFVSRRTFRIPSEKLRFSP
jgi:hypothetical protein